MPYLLAFVLGVLAIGLAALLRSRTSKFSAEQGAAAAEHRQLDEQLTAAQSRERRSLEALGETQAELDCTKGELAEARDQIKDLDEEIEAADRLANDQAAELASLAIETDELKGRLAGVQLDLEGARKESASIQAELAQLRDVASNQTPGPESGPRHAAALWQLELTRSERTWRYSVAVMPDDPSPYPECQDLLKLAIETEAEALCGDVGAVIAVEVDDNMASDPATSLLILRLAQELLAAAARLQEPTRFTATKTGDTIEFAVAPQDDGALIDLDLADLVHRTAGDGVKATTNGSSISLLLA